MNINVKFKYNDGTEVVKTVPNSVKTYFSLSGVLSKLATVQFIRSYAQKEADTQYGNWIIDLYKEINATNLSEIICYSEDKDYARITPNQSEASYINGEYRIEISRENENDLREVLNYFVTYESWEELDV